MGVSRKHTFERHKLSAASKITMIVWPTLSLWVGLAHTFGDPARTATPSFAYARSLMDVKFWGIFFLVVAVIEIAAWLTGNIQFMRFGLVCGMTFCSVWALGFAISIFTTEDASLNGPAVWGAIAALQLASLESLKKDMRE